MATLRDIVIALRVKDNTKGLDTANDKLQTAKGSASALGKEIKGLVAGLGAMAAAKKAWDAIENAVDANAKFGQGIAQIATLLPGQTSRVAELQKGIIEMSERTGKPLEDLTQGVYQVVSAFGDSKDTLKLTELAARSATAGMSSTEEALGLLSSGTVASDSFVRGAGARALDLNDYFLLDTAQGLLLFDSDGSGPAAPMELVQLVGVDYAAMSGADIFVGV